MSRRLRAIWYSVDSDTAKRNGPAVRAVIRAENCSGTVSTEIPKTALHTLSRQYEDFSRAPSAPVDQMSTCVAEADASAARVCPVALSTIFIALPRPGSLKSARVVTQRIYPFCGANAAGRGATFRERTTGKSISLMRDCRLSDGRTLLVDPL